MFILFFHVGSENNTVFLYSNKLSKPLLTYKFDDGVANSKKEEGMNDFVSAVCWSNVRFEKMNKLTLGS